MGRGFISKCRDFEVYVFASGWENIEVIVEEAIKGKVGEGEVRRGLGREV